MRGTGAMVLAGILGVFFAGCGGTEESWSPVTAADLSDTGRDRLERAKGAAMLLGHRLMGRLTEVIADGGLTRAVSVCRDEAPRLAREVADETGLRIGRTSHRLRSPANAAPDWIPDLTVDTPRILRGPGGALRVTLPIRAKAMCVQCHGADADIDPGVRAALDAAYPEDRARGFAEGDLRGLFWIEVPGGNGD